jgi:hypothetical protein
LITIYTSWKMKLCGAYRVICKLSMNDRKWHPKRKRLKKSILTPCDDQSWLALEVIVTGVYFFIARYVYDLENICRKSTTYAKRHQSRNQHERIRDRCNLI